MTERVFQAIDLDRTLLDTVAVEKKVNDVLRIFDPDLANEVVSVSAQFLQEGKSFQLFDYVKAKLGEQSNQEFLNLLRGLTAPGDVLLPGADERIAYAFSQDEWSGGIVTYGKPEGQLLKLELSGLDTYPYMITDTLGKGAIIASWRHNGVYEIPETLGGGVFDTVTLDDDKLAAFDELPDTAYGVWVNNDADDAILNEKGLQGRVAIASNLFEAVEKQRQFLEQ